MSDLDRVRQDEYCFTIGALPFKLYVDTSDKSTREYIYVMDAYGVVQRDCLQGYKTIQAAKDAMERDVRDFVRDLNKSLKVIKDERNERIGERNE